MSKFNKKNTIKTTNHTGSSAYELTKKEKLVSAVLTTMYSEKKFYKEDDSEDILKMASEMCHEDPEFVAKLTVFARKEMNLRSVSHVLVCIIAREAHEYTRKVLRQIIIRPDDILEIMSFYKQRFGKPFPNAMKKEIAEQIKKFDSYQLAKYKNKGKDVAMRDVFRIVHPKPDSEEMSILFNKVLNNTLETPETWEVLISKNGNNYSDWRHLLDEKKLPYMAMLRNLANIIEASDSDEDVKPFLNYLTNPIAVRNSKQLPFRFYSAYKTLKREMLLTADVKNALSKALSISIENMPKFSGRTLIAVDSSGSMNGPAISAKTAVTPADIANLLGAMSATMCEDATICRFDAILRLDLIRPKRPPRKGYEIKHIGKYDNILDVISSWSALGGGTDLGLPLQYALNEDPARDTKPFDRIIYLSDNEANNFVHGKGMSLLEEYKKKYNPNVILHCVDLQGYGTTQFYGKNIYNYAGWSERLMLFISLVEKGMDSMVSLVESYQI